MKKLSLIIFICLFSNNVLAKNIHVLFIGNSYVFGNNMPDIIEELSKSDPTSGVKVIVDEVTRGGAKLLDHWNEKIALNKIQSKKWDYVVLQEQSSWALSDFDIENSYRVAPKFNSAMASSTKNKLLFVTWPRKKSSSWYRGKTGTFFKNYDYMKRRLDSKSPKLANLLGAKMMRIGEYWHFINKNYPQINLYQSDGSHPNILGSYFNALLFYKVFSGSKNIKNIKYQPKSINESNANLLRQIVGS